MKRLDRWFQGLAVGRRFGSDLRPFRGQLAGIGGLSFLLTGLSLLRPWPIKWIVDGALMPMEESRFSAETIVWGAVGAAMAIAVAHALIQYGREISLGMVNHMVTRGLRYRIFSHISRMSPFFFARHKSGDLLIRLMGDVPAVTAMMVDSTVELATRSLLIVGTVAWMFYLDAQLTVVLVLALPLVLLLVRWVSSHITIAVRKQRRKEGDLADYLHEAIAAAPVIQSLGGSDHVVRRFARSNRRSARAGLKAKRLAARMSASVESLLGVALAATLAFGSLRVLDGDLKTGELLVFLSYVRGILKPIRSASKHGERIAKGTACGERILGILDEGPSVSSRPGAPPAPEDPAELCFEKVSFSYEAGPPAISDVSFTLRRGQLTALVGRSGAGKTTVASLALRLFDPDAGRVTLEGESLRDLDLDSVRDRIGLCMQRTVLLGETIRENLLIASPGADDEELWRACREADAEDFLKRLPDGLDTRLGGGGVGLSGGQQNRLSLARTLLRRSPILIVDEPFAGLDREAAHRTGETLRRLARKRIVIVIAHDIENLDAYDRIVFLDSGRVVATGNHAELTERVPLYRQVVRQTMETST